MIADTAIKRIEMFEKRFGTSHLYFAYHAAFPLALTPDLLYRLWATFQKDINGKQLHIPWIAVSNLLLSGICHEIDDEIYEIGAEVRNELLAHLKGDLRFGVQRIQELSRFLIEYTEQQLRLDSTNPDIQMFAKTQQIAARAYIYPDETARELATMYRDIVLDASSSTFRKKTELMQMAALVEASMESLKDMRFDSLRVYARGMASFSRGDVDSAANQLGSIAEEKGQIRVSNVVLPVPEQIKARQPSLRRPQPDLTRQEYRNRQTLINKICSYWIEGVLENSLQTKALITLGLEEQPEAVNSSHNLVWSLPRESDQALPSGTKIIDRLDAIGSGRRLLILGEPGAGKTTALLELARDLLARAEQDVNQPVPVVLNLSSWTNRKQSIYKWIIEELFEKYQVPRETGEIWVRQERFILLLDGLDEVMPDYRNDCVQAINHFSQEYEPEIVVCSRISDYEALSNRLSFQAAVLIKALTAQQIDAFMSRLPEEFAELRSLIKINTSIQELAQSPLLLNIMLIAYREIATKDLLRSEQNNLLDLLFKAYIDKIFNRQQGKINSYTRKKITIWLRWIANKMQDESKTVFLIENLQPTLIESNFTKQFYRFEILQITNLMIGTIFLSMFTHPSSSSFNEIVFVSIAILISSFMFASIYGMFLSLIFKLTSEKIFKFISAAAGGILYGPCIAIISNFLREDWQPFSDAINIMLIISSSQISSIFWWKIASNLYLEDIDPVESLKWSYARVFQKFKASLFISAISVGILWMAIAIDDSSSWDIFFVFPLVALLISIGYGIIDGFCKDSDIRSDIYPNQGIRMSFINTFKSAFAGSVVGLILSFLGIFIYSIVSSESPDYFFLGIGVSSGFAVGILLGSQGSGIVCIQHFILRLILWQSGCLPWNCARFLDYATELGFLRKVGGGYIFIHRLFLEYFARLPQDSSKARTIDSAS